MALIAAALVVSACTGTSTSPTAGSDRSPTAASSSGTQSSSGTGPSSGPPTTSGTSAAAASYGPPVVAGSDYLALGDSVSFGYREPDASPTPDYADQSDLVGFPELVARAWKLHVANASCPGETSASLIDSAAASFGCERGADGNADDGYRTHYPLHVGYSGSQLAFGLRYLRTHPDTRLVTLMIGANDAFRCEATTKDQCTTEFPALLAGISRNVGTIVHALRDEAHYAGRIVLVTYYASTYNGFAATASSTLNAAVTAGADGYRALVADGFSAFEQAAKSDDGDSCDAGLLTRLSSGGCGVHPSALGQQLLAAAVEHAARA